MKLSARNQLKRKITEVSRGPTTTKVKIDIGGTVLTASSTTEAADDLSLGNGDSCGSDQSV